jgi:phosphopantothenoylcysteine decarboxylase/phosphopantothenate--cysteine ligase
LVRVQSAAQMLAAVNDRFEEADVAIWAAAVADYTPSQVADQKIKKTERTFEIQLTKTQDIAAAMGQRKRPEQIVVGFALETNNELANALDKLRKKNFDLIVLNSLRDANAGFGYDTNKITVIDRHEQITHFELKPKKDVAQDIIGLILAKLA